MTGVPPADILRYLTGAGTGVADRELLARYAADRDGTAFAEIVRRHGPVVLAVCRRGVGHYHDADDAFQAVFLILARRAGSIREPDLLGNWLYRVAVRVAKDSRRSAVRRRAREVQVVNVPEPVAPPDVQDDLGHVIDEELAALPAYYREAVVLCDLRGISRADAAALLGIPLGTLASRLDTARKKLAARLTRRGVTLAVAVVPGVLGGGRGVAVPEALVMKTCDWAAGGVVPAAVLLLVHGGVMMRKALLVGLVASALVAGVGLAARPGEKPMPKSAEPPKPAAVTGLKPSPPADGVYPFLFAGDGLKVTLSSGNEVVLGPRLSPSVGTAVSLQSMNNDNTYFVLRLRGLAPLPTAAAPGHKVLVAGGAAVHLSIPDRAADDATAVADAYVYSAAAARALAARYKTEMVVRKHPGHRFEVRWVPTKPEFEAGRPVELKMELTNTGAGPLRFTHGGKQRGTRDNQFRFIAQPGGEGQALADTGDPRHHGGIVQSVTLKPGEVHSAVVDVAKWFTFAESGSYAVTGVMEMPVVDPTSEDPWHPVVWDDLAVGVCAVRVVAKKK